VTLSEVDVANSCARAQTSAYCGRVCRPPPSRLPADAVGDLSNRSADRHKDPLAKTIGPTTRWEPLITG